MATIIPSRAMVRRLLPVVLVEAAVVIGCTLAFVSTGNLLWIAALVAVVLAAAVYLVVQLVRHRDEWRWERGLLRAAGDKDEGR